MTNIQDKLDKLGWKQNKFADRIGVNKVTVSNWCTGKDTTPMIVNVYIDQCILLKNLYETIKPENNKRKNSKFRK